MRGAPPASVSLSARLALWAIRRYQRRLSPRKGFSCAYRIHRGGAGCSAHGYRVIQRHGLALGLPLLLRRLERCGGIHRATLDTRNPVLHYQRGECDILPCDGCGKGAPLGQCMCDLGCNSACDYGYDKIKRRLDAWRDALARRRARRHPRPGPP